VNCGYLVLTAAGALAPGPYYAGTPAGLIAATMAAQALMPPGTVLPLGGGVIDSGSLIASCGG
jgi:hypothetical protein